MENDLVINQMVPSAQLCGIKFGLMSGDDIEKFSHVSINDGSDLIGTKLGLPNAASQCTTCGSTNIRDCEGHFGVIKLPTPIYHPFLVQEVVHLLNLICPGCYSIKKETKKDLQIKKKLRYLQKLLLKMEFDKMPKNQGLLSQVANIHVKHLNSSGHKKTWNENQERCKYCSTDSAGWYPAIKFKAVLKDAQGKKCVAITAEFNEKVPRKFRNKSLSDALPVDFWNFIPLVQQDKSKPTDIHKITISPAQVFYLLRKLDQELIRQFVSKREFIFLSCIPVSPNCQRMVERSPMYSDGPRLSFDKCTKAYRGVVDVSRKIVEFNRQQQFGPVASSYIASRVQDCLFTSKLHSNTTSIEEQRSFSLLKKDQPACTGLKWMKDVVLSKRTDNTFRMIMIGDPKIQMGEIGLPQENAEALYIAEHVNFQNVEKLKSICDFHLLSKMELHTRREGKLTSLRRSNQLQVGDILFKPLEDGDLIMVNRNPSVHQHSLLALSVKILSFKSVVSINPLCCAPLGGDFDGDCLHGYVPQSIRARVELSELLSLDHQLFNAQDGRSLLSLTHDSLTAAHLLMKGEVFLNKFEVQQLEMLCSRGSQYPSIVKAPTICSPQWNGMQLFSMLLPIDMYFSSESSIVEISKGDLVHSPGISFSSQNNISEIFSQMFRRYGSKANDYLYSFQEALCEFLTMRGLSVSLHDIYLTSDFYTRKKLIDEVSCALEEARRACCFNELMLDPEMGYLIKSLDETDDKSHTINMSDFTRGRRPINPASIGRFKAIFRDLQNLIHHFVSTENSLFTMMHAGSKGSLQKLVQQGVCLGLQLSAKPLPFSVPQKLNCSAWNQLKVFDRSVCIRDPLNFSEGDNSYAVVENSFIDGLNPLECFFHALSCRSNMFSDNADVPGTLTRKLMFYIRDIYGAYDGTVRNAYGQQIVQFSYDSSEEKSSKDCERPQVFSEQNSECNNRIGGDPVGSLAACAISEAAYAALDQPVNSLESSPLLNLKKVLECGPSRTSTDRTASLALSDKLKRLNYGFEYGALAVKNHLDRVFFSDVVTSVMIFYATQPEESTRPKCSPWISHFHVNKELMMRKKINVNSIVNALTENYDSFRDGKSLPGLLMTSQNCEVDNVQKKYEELCISVAVEDSNSSLLLDIVRDTVIPVLLQTLIRGFMEFKKVDIMWDSDSEPDGQLYVKVAMSERCSPGMFWGTLQNACIPIMNLIDWKQSHPDSVYDISDAFGVVSAWSYFLGSLKSAISDVGRNIHVEHLLILADSLSVTGEFHGPSAKGLKQQRADMSISSPFAQACFSNPEKCFIEAGKKGLEDSLYGMVDALAWGLEAPVGTGGPFNIMYSAKVDSPKQTENIYGTLLNMTNHRSSQTCCTDKWEEQSVYTNTPWSEKWKQQAAVADSLGADKWMGQAVVANSVGNLKGWDKSGRIAKEQTSQQRQHQQKQRSSRVKKQTRVRLESKFSSMHIGPWDNINAMVSSLRELLYQFPINHLLNDSDRSLIMEALEYHPKKDAKIGTGITEIKIGHNPSHPESRCFMLIRNDGTTEDFSYRKCVVEAAKQISTDFGSTIERELYRR